MKNNLIERSSSVFQDGQGFRHPFQSRNSPSEAVFQQPARHRLGKERLYRSRHRSHRQARACPPQRGTRQAARTHRLLAPAPRSHGAVRVCVRSHSLAGRRPSYGTSPAFWWRPDGTGVSTQSRRCSPGTALRAGLLRVQAASPTH